MLRNTFCEILASSRRVKYFKLVITGRISSTVHGGINEVMYCTIVFIASVLMPVVIINPTAMPFSADLFIPNYSQKENLVSYATTTNWLGFGRSVIPTTACLGSSTRIFSGVDLPGLWMCMSAIWLPSLHWSKTANFVKLTLMTDFSYCRKAVYFRPII